MKYIARYVYILFIVIGSASPLAGAASIETDHSSALSVGTLKTRSHMLEIYAAEHGAVYTVKSIAGDVLAADLSMAELSSRFPKLGSIVRGYADDASLSPERSHILQEIH